MVFFTRVAGRHSLQKVFLLKLSKVKYSASWNMLLFTNLASESVSPLWQDDTVLAELFFLFAHETLNPNHEEDYYYFL